jgi:raffinose synthase
MISEERHVRIGDGKIVCRGRTWVHGVSDAITVDDEARRAENEVFLRARAKQSGSRHLFALGTPELERFTVCHRYEPFWMKPAAGTSIGDVPPETQFLLGQLTGGGFLVLVPLVDDLFRFSLRGKPDHSLELVAETGDSFAPGNGGLALYAAAGDDPFELVERGARSVDARLGNGRLRAEKSLPDFVDAFGWCTWDAFYQEVSAEKVVDGLEHFARGGVPPRLLILDDGWQSTTTMDTGERRLTAFTANEKFPGGLEPTVKAARQRGVEFFFVWHAMIGYWGGVDRAGLPDYGVVDQVRGFGEGVMAHKPTFNHDWWSSLVGLVPAAHVARFFDDYHSYLESQGVDGVKVDNQAVLEGVAQRQGGRVPLTRAYRAALEGSVERHFSGRLINCMSNAQETWYGSPRSTLLRSSIDFFPRMPETHGMHLYTNAQVGLWFGNFMHPDWDMFQSGHEWGAYHAAGRAISGGPVYVSDRPGEHDFALLKKLVCSDGRVLRCDRPGLSTLDTLFADTTREDVPLKIWNRNGERAVVGAFNARYTTPSSTVVRGSVGPGDVPGFLGERFACLMHNAGTITTMDRDESKPVILDQGAFELFTFAPIEAGFAALGLADKLNSGGAVREVVRHSATAIDVLLRDGGRFAAWSEIRPASVKASGEPVAFSYDEKTGALMVDIPTGAATTVSVHG